MAVCVASKGDQQAVMGRVEVLHQDERHAVPVRQALDQLRARLEPPADAPIPTTVSKAGCGVPETGIPRWTLEWRVVSGIKVQFFCG